jgi:hypothetical protein
MEKTKEPVKGITETSFENYLELNQLGGLPKDSIQYIQLKRAFFGGVSDMIFGDTSVIYCENEDDGMAKIDAIVEELTVFWDSQMGAQDINAKMMGIDPKDQKQNIVAYTVDNPFKAGIEKYHASEKQ